MAPTSRRANHLGSEEGAILLVALLFITIGSLVVVSLANLSGTNLLNTSAVQAQRNAEYAADAATDSAIQAVRYHGSCESFPPSGSFSIDGYNVFVSCTGTPMSGASISGTKLVPPSGATFVPEDVGLQVYDQYLPNGGFSTVTAYNTSDGTLTVAAAASQPDNSALLGTPLQRTVLLSACASTTSTTTIKTCAPGNAVVTAVVLYYDTDAAGNPTPGGYNTVVQRWDVNSANS